jgi:hypothetical protein
MTTSLDKSLSQKFDQVSQELRTLMNMMSRIDERVEIFVDKQEQLSVKMDDHIQNCPVKCEFPEYLARLSVLEKTTLPRNEQNWSKEDKQKLDNEISDLRNNVQKMELSSQQIAFAANKHEGHWQNIGKFTFQIIVYVLGVVAAAGLLHLLQLKISN